MLQLQKATRKKSKLRLNISGPSGSGKTYSALLMAKGLVGDWTKIGVIDTETGSASLYEHLGDFQAVDLQAPYTPERYIEAIDLCVRGGMECIIIDSSTHEWSGQGGCIEINDKLAQSKYKGNTWSAWSQTTPRHDAFVQKVLQCPVHVITCTRSKIETVMTDDKKVKKLGMKDIQREGWEYELTVSLNLDRDTHTATASKDRTELFDKLDPFVITEATGKMIADWCDKGITVDPPKVTTGVKVTIHDEIPNAAVAEDFYPAWQTAVNACETVEKLQELWEGNKATCEADPKIKTMFANRKKELK